MSKFFQAMQEAARESGEAPALPLPDATRFRPVAPQTAAGQTAGDGAGEPLPYRRVAPRPNSSTILPPASLLYLAIE